MSGMFPFAVMISAILFTFTTTGESSKIGCNRICPLEHSPVCATNGVTYESDCHFQVAACRLNNEISILRKGSCVS